MRIKNLTKWSASNLSLSTSLLNISFLDILIARRKLRASSAFAVACLSRSSSIICRSRVSFLDINRLVLRGFTGYVEGKMSSDWMLESESESSTTKLLSMSRRSLRISAFVSSWMPVKSIKISRRIGNYKYESISRVM